MKKKNQGFIRTCRKRKKRENTSRDRRILRRERERDSNLAGSYGCTGIRSRGDVLTTEMTRDPHEMKVPETRKQLVLHSRFGSSTVYSTLLDHALSPHGRPSWSAHMKIEILGKLCLRKNVVIFLNFRFLLECY